MPSLASNLAIYMRVTPLFEGYTECDQCDMSRIVSSAPYNLPYAHFREATAVFSCFTYARKQSSQEIEIVHDRPMMSHA